MKNKLIELINDKQPIVKIMDYFNVNRKTLNFMLKELESEYFIEFKGNTIILKKFNTHEFYTIKTNNINNNKFMFLSDTHLGCKDEALFLLNEAYEHAYKLGIQTVFHCGDFLDGIFSKDEEQLNNLHYKNGLEQLLYSCAVYPKNNTITTYLVTGNHDKTLLKESQIIVGDEI